MSKFTAIRTTMSKNKGRTGATAAAGLIILGAVTGMATSALFTSTDEAASYAATGHVEISVTDKFTVANVLPGVPRSAELVVDNTKSSAPVALSLSKVSKVNVKNLQGADLSQFTVKIVDNNGKVVYGPVAANALAAGPIDVVIGANGTWKGKVVWELPAGAGDEFQDVAVHYASVSITGTQVLPAN